MNVDLYAAQNGMSIYFFLPRASHVQVLHMNCILRYKLELAEKEKSSVESRLNAKVEEAHKAASHVQENLAKQEGRALSLEEENDVLKVKLARMSEIKATLDEVQKDKIALDIEKRELQSKNTELETLKQK